MAWRSVLVGAALIGLTVPANAGVIFNRNKKPPAEQAAELVKILKQDSDERRRVSAVSELKKIDPRVSPAVVPTLLEALLGDPSPAVRVGAAQALTKYRPVSPQIGQALEDTFQNDSSPQVRQALRPLVTQYQAAGYRPPARSGDAAVEAPLAKLAPAKPQPAPAVARPSSRGKSVRETVEPPLALDPSVVQTVPQVPAAPRPIASNVKESVAPANRDLVPPRLILDEPQAAPLRSSAKPPIVTKPTTKAPARPAEKIVEGPILNPPE